MPKSKSRKKQQQTRARQTQVDQRQAERRTITPRAYRVRRISGSSLITVAIIVGVSHFLEHLGVWSFAAPGVEDLVAGYPMAAILGVAGLLLLPSAV